MTDGTHEDEIGAGGSAADSWQECSDWKDLPEGDWLVKIDNGRKPYHIANVTTKTAHGHKMIIVGNHFHFDMGNIIAYSPFDRYEA